MKFNDEQQKAIESTEKRILVLAGPGSGKTTVLTHRIAHLLKNGISAHNILAITFTNKAAEEMRERLAKLVGETQVHKLTARTFHSFAYRSLVQWGERIGYISPPTIYDEQDRSDLIEGIAKRLNVKVSKKALLSDIAEFGATRKKPEHPEIAMVLEEYMSLLQDHVAVDYDILQIELLRLLEEEDIGNYFRDQYKHVLVDEMQDTNHVQYEILNTLEPENLFCVGDADQCVYQWRHAAPELLFTFIEEHEPEVLRLEECYRCPIPVAEAANRLITHTEKRLPKEIKTDKDGVSIGFIDCPNPYAEFELVTTMIRGQLETSQPKDIYVLGRTNIHLRKFSQRFEKTGIPFQLLTKEIDLWRQAGVREVIYCLQLVANPRSTWSAQNCYFAKQKGPMEILKMQVEAKKKRKLLSRVMQEHIPDLHDFLQGTNREDDVFNTALSLETVFKVSSGMQCRGLTGQGETIADLLDWLYAWRSERTSGTISAFLEWYWGRSMQDDLKLEEDSVKIMTVHGAKGLEAKIVFIIGATQGLFPIGRSPIDEERRLFFVAMTRAVEKLFISSPDEVNRWQKGTSQFIEEAIL